MKICVVGAGNIGLVTASVLALGKENEIVVYSKKEFGIADFEYNNAETGEVFRNLDFTVESSLQKALDGAKYIFCTYPAFLRQKFIEECIDYIPENSFLGFVPGYGGAEYMCNSLVKKGVTIFGLQRVPFVARQEDKKKATMLSKKDNLYIATIPKSKTPEVCSVVEKLLGIPVVALKEYLAVTLVPSNPLLHLTGIYNVFKDYKEGDSFDRQLMFYAEWNDETSELLLQYDDELQEICSKMKPLVLDEIVSLRTYYESQTAQRMTQKLKSIKAFEVVKVPLTEKDGKFYPDFDSRMFIEDFPFGIAIIKYFAVQTNTKTPAIDKILKFYQDKTGIYYFNDDSTYGKDFAKTGAPANFGLDTLEDVIKFYIQ